LLTFDNNRGNSSLVLTRALFVNNEIYKPFVLLERKGYLEKMNNLPKHHGAGPSVAASVALA